ncbi:MAG: pyridoxamine 5'-phosphate oxidase family protein [Gammaproteobacteria bacterium]|nr:pyridoxamine 5'-phosphate oxidase family protein [Gammaproteobacteria bacterium]
MNDLISLDPVATPFHPGEQAVQITSGVRDEAEARGLKMLTARLVDAQREFFAQLSFVIVARVDQHGQPRAELITGQPGFIQATVDGQVRIERGEAGHNTALASVVPGSQLGLLGIEFARRRRNRINGTVTEVSDQHVSLSIDQGYGNCPKYITKRAWDETQFTGVYRAQVADHVSPAVADIIARTDTFFIASSSGPATQDSDIQAAAWGADISHRGGEPGFLQLQNDMLLFDDYPGNNLFNTLGNLRLHPPCGIIILDFTTGDIVQLDGKAELQRDEEHYRVAVKVMRVRHLAKGTG